ncbi:MAG: ABC-F family ATP-binding cassette domain-containing protein [Clostridiaceae bacterium]|nr:ABC-F family ATP-binding cassette domain-containing protein [Clostridiaceae bacterium]
MSLIAVQAVQKHYFGHPVLQDISFQLDRGERLCLLGSNGAGKTTLLRLIMGLEKPDGGQIVVASQTIRGYLPQQLPADAPEDASWTSPEIRQLESAMRQTELELETLGQDAAQAGPLQAVLTRYADLTARYEALGGYQHRHLMEEALAGLGLTGDVLSRPLATLSGGERMRVALARLIIRNPDLLLLDEPTNHLDLDALEWLEQYLTRFRGSVLLVSHDRTFIDRTATAVAELDAGRLRIRPGNYSRFVAQSEAEAVTLEREIKKIARELERQQEVTQTMLSHRNMSQYHAREKVVARLSTQLEETIGRAHSASQKLSFQFVPGLTTGDPDRILLETIGLAGGYGQGLLFHDVSFVLRARAKACLCGPNGCGKTTLLNLLRGEMTAAEGRVRLAAQMSVGTLGQHVIFADESRTVLDELLSRATLSEAQGRDLLARYGFRDTHVYKQLQVLSGGERSRLYLACLLLEEPNILFLDEPTNHLDIYSREVLEKALLSFNGAILAVSHDRMFIERCCSLVLGFIGSRVLPFDSFEAYRQAARVAESQERPPAPAPDRQPDSSAARRRFNRAQERRETALRKEQLRALENEIELSETKKAELEAAFSAETGPDAYEAYAGLLEDLERKYQAYLRLASEEPVSEDEPG